MSNDKAPNVTVKIGELLERTRTQTRQWIQLSCIKLSSKVFGGVAHQLDLTSS